VCLVGAGFAVAALALVAIFVRAARDTEIDDLDLELDELFIEDDGAALAERAAIELV
jgi:hypothetical protein